MGEKKDQMISAPSQQEGILSFICRYFGTFFFGCLGVCIPICWCNVFWIIKKYERAVNFRYGKLIEPAIGEGIHYFIPFVDLPRRIDMRIKTIDVPTQEMMTKDSVTVKVNAVVYYRINDAIKVVTMVENYCRATSLLAQTTLRAVVGECELDELLQNREKISSKLNSILDEATDVWGIKVRNVEVKDVLLPKNMQRAMASQAEAERERRAKIISAEGEHQASKTLLEAANEMTKNHATLQLRYLQTLTQISVEKNSTIVFPLPMELMRAFSDNKN